MAYTICMLISLSHKSIKYKDGWSRAGMVALLPNPSGSHPPSLWCGPPPFGIQFCHQHYQIKILVSSLTISLGHPNSIKPSSRSHLQKTFPDPAAGRLDPSFAWDSSCVPLCLTFPIRLSAPKGKIQAKVTFLVHQDSAQHLTHTVE